MKKIMLVGFAALLILTGCNKKEEKKDPTLDALAKQEQLNQATREELQAALTERDELLDIINGISSDMAQIQSVENIVTTTRVGEGSQKQNLQSNLASIKNTLAQRRQKLADLETKLKDSKLTNQNLLQTIDNLKKQIDEQTAQIEALTASLESANQRIGQLNNKVDTLTNTVKRVTDERDVAQEEAKHQTDLANVCYYAVGSKKELKQHNILESGFLKKTKVMEKDFDKSFFKVADKRTLTTIPLYSKKAKIITGSQPADSYQIIEENGQKVLKITNPSKFWSVSNYVVIQID